MFAARLVSACGTAMTPVALPFAVLEDVGGRPHEVGLVVAAGSVTQIIVQLFGGALADRGSRRQMVEIRTRRSLPSGCSVAAARGYGPQIRTVIRGVLHAIPQRPFRERAQ